MEHELGHVHLAEDGAHGLDRTLRALPQMPSCDELMRLAKREGDRASDETNRQNEDYDLQTHHGATQGAYGKR